MDALSQTSLNKAYHALHSRPIATVLLAGMIYTALTPHHAHAEWLINPDKKDALADETAVAYVINDDGYTFEVYKDSFSAIRGRFSIQDRMLALGQQHCPSYQIDRGAPSNTSVAGDPCLSTDTRAEYIFGIIQNNQIISPPLLAMMSGLTMTFRFRLKNGDYHETRFSLRGSRRVLTSVLSDQVVVLSQ